MRACESTDLCCVVHVYCCRGAEPAVRCKGPQHAGLSGRVPTIPASHAYNCIFLAFGGMEAALASGGPAREHQRPRAGLRALAVPLLVPCNNSHARCTG